MKVHYFQRYQKAEDVHTSNTILLLSRLYHYSPNKFFYFLRNILPDNANTTLEFAIQETTPEGSILDAIIMQPSFKIAIETKLAGNFTGLQLKRHISVFKNEDYKILLTIDPKPMEQSKKEKLNENLKKYNQKEGLNIIHTHITFDEIINILNEIIDDIRDYEFIEILDDYQEYCHYSNLIRSEVNHMIIRTVNDTLDNNIELNLYTDDFSKNYHIQTYLGLYKEKAVRAIGKIETIAIIHRDGDSLIIENEYGETTDEMKKSAREALNVFNKTKLRFYFVKRFFVTDFKKKSARGLQGSKNFNLCDVLELDELPDTETIAEKLQTKEW
ncbi:MAG: hypothetical protein LBC73_04990 [Oscillospiraceae bacterium]|jgi:hypothetical protein|nr:hypothetical protein [Oscillospiraceae bacterium]